MAEDENQRIVVLENKVNMLENVVLDLQKNIQPFPLWAKKKTRSKTNLTGLNGGVNLLISEGFFDEPRNLNAVRTALAEKSYHYGVAAISKALSIYFMKRDRALVRFKTAGEKTYSYAVRK